MLRKIIAGLAALVLLGPMVVLVSVGLLVNPSTVSCADAGGSVQVGDIPDSLTATTRNGETVVLDRQQLTHAATIIDHRREDSGGGAAGRGDRADGGADRVAPADARQHRHIPRVGELPQRRQRLRPRQPRPVPDAPASPGGAPSQS